MILTELPDVSPRPLTPSNRDFRRWFYERWGRENAVVTGDAASIEFAPYRQCLSIKRCWRGTETFMLDARRLAVDSEHYLILNEGAEYGAAIQGHVPTTSLAIFFRPDMGTRVAGAALQSFDAALDHEANEPAQPFGFAENLRPLDPAIDHRIALIKLAIESGQRDEQWLEEQLQGLLWAMLHAEQGWQQRSHALAPACRSAHAELLRRIDRATDLIISSHTEPLTLDDMARAARLSKYHLVRMFRRVHGTTPVAMLTDLRTRTAARLIQQTSLGLDEVVALSGFGSRQTLFRQLRRLFSTGGRALRERLDERLAEVPAAT
jgi:AraC-like DNA-binding protein